MSKRIVVVDDDKEVQEIITFALTRNGFDVSVASHGQHLQQLLAAQTPDLIILDVMMPGWMDIRYLGVCARIRPRNISRSLL